MGNLFLILSSFSVTDLQSKPVMKTFERSTDSLVKSLVQSRSLGLAPRNGRNANSSGTTCIPYTMKIQPQKIN
eukprot:s4210_g1.t1